ncbi:porin family protein [Rheinheimera muenzenbergensis]|uniref:Porin family protein n=1 Tax=Rheinheimera muenzenbergensis TaxID=1193628 RepID=A0ABU8C133_9GAMM
MKNVLGALSVVAALCAMPALADTEHTGFFIGGGVSNFDLDIKYVNEDLSATGFTLYGGYNFSNWFGIEASVNAATDLGDNNSDLTAAAIIVGPKFSYNLNDTITLFAKAGLASVAVVDNYYAEDRGDWDWGDEADYSGLGYSYGLGSRFAVTKHLNIRLAYEYISAELDADSSYFYDIDTELSVFSLGLHYQF